MNHLVEGKGTLNDEDNYVRREDGKANYDIAYYFPLRNEKNKTFLRAHIDYLEEELEKIEFNAGLSLADNEILAHMSQNLFKDVQIIRRRLIGLGMIEGQTSKTFDKTIMLDYLQKNMLTNLRCKMEIVDKLTEEKNDAFEEKKEHLDKGKASRVRPESNLG